MKALPLNETLGIVGGGQLGYMMGIAARQLGYRLAVLDPDPCAPAMAIADVKITAAFDDINAFASLAQACQVVTYEFEHIDVATLSSVTEHSTLPQGIALLRLAQHRLLEKEAITRLGLPVAPYRAITQKSDATAAATQGFPAVLKTCEGGYDGKGQAVVHNDAELHDAVTRLLPHGPLVLERWIAFEREISVIVTRNAHGDTAVFPVAENEHRHNILYRTLVPARITPTTDTNARTLALQLAEGLSLIGTLAVEMFVLDDGSLYINEIAPRPHNSGHFTLDACACSQFEQHVRAVCGLPLGSTEQHSACVMENILGDRVAALGQQRNHLNDVHLHWYGKHEARPARKMGHITALGATTTDCQRQLDAFWTHSD